MRRNLIFILVAVAIVMAVGVGYVFYFNTKANSVPNYLTAMRPVGPDDHILGNPAAPVMLVEYCDIDSPFCKQFQAVLEAIIAAYGAGGSVAWTYRHLPVVDQYPNGVEDAEASECVAALGGTSDFFKFIDALDAAAPGENTFDPAGYGSLVTTLGIDTNAFSQCLSAHTYEKRVADDANNALAAGADGAPYTIVLVNGIKPIPISGALSYAQLNQIVEAGIAENK